MEKAQRQRGSIVLHKEEKDGVDYVRIEYAGNGAIPCCSPRIQAWK